jgi:uncharacterized protein
MKKTAVIDTNVLVSGVFWKGPPYRLIKSWQQGSFKWLASPEIFDEYRRVLEEIAREYPGIEYRSILEIIELNCEFFNAKPVRGVCKDPDDDKFIAAALAGDADYLVSGDKYLLDVGSYHRTKIVRPAFFLQNV